MAQFFFLLKNEHIDVSPHPTLLSIISEAPREEEWILFRGDFEQNLNSQVVDVSIFPKWLDSMKKTFLARPEVWGEKYIDYRVTFYV